MPLRRGLTIACFIVISHKPTTFVVQVEKSVAFVFVCHYVCAFKQQLWS